MIKWWWVPSAAPCSGSNLSAIHQRAMVLQGQCQEYLKKAEYALQTVSHDFHFFLQSCSMALSGSELICWFLFQKKKHHVAASVSVGMKMQKEWQKCHLVINWVTGWEGFLCVTDHEKWTLLLMKAFCLSPWWTCFCRHTLLSGI